MKRALRDYLLLQSVVTDVTKSIYTDFSPLDKVSSKSRKSREIAIIITRVGNNNITDLEANILLNDGLFQVSIFGSLNKTKINSRSTESVEGEQDNIDFIDGFTETVRDLLHGFSGTMSTIDVSSIIENTARSNMGSTEAKKTTYENQIDFKIYYKKQ